ncbi:MAG TPA: hypothetical protein VKZ41_07610, partial [Gemmatimonadales bacterium]|nr:hypothetical protein [Gemmatimonadales bacterium]
DRRSALVKVRGWRSGASSAGGANEKASRGDAEVAERSLTHGIPIAVQFSATSASPRETVVFSLQGIENGSSAG